jgi:hypothetical protein
MLASIVRWPDESWTVTLGVTHRDLDSCEPDDALIWQLKRLPVIAEPLVVVLADSGHFGTARRRRKLFDVLQLHYPDDNFFLPILLTQTSRAQLRRGRDLAFGNPLAKSTAAGWQFCREISVRCRATRRALRDAWRVDARGGPHDVYPEDTAE